MGRVPPGRNNKPCSSPYAVRETKLKDPPDQGHRLKQEYAQDPWPFNDVLMNLALELDMTFETVYEWFAKQRAEVVGLKSGIVEAVLDAEECLTFTSWRLYVAQFGTKKYRARIIKAQQDPKTLYGFNFAHVSWRKGLEPPLNAPANFLPGDTMGLRTPGGQHHENRNDIDSKGQVSLYPIRNIRGV